MFTSFALLPTEVQCSIIRLLDPIALISLSQSNTHFRRLVNPQKKHFVERLLALELLSSYGGPIPTFRSRDNYIADPSPVDPEWDDIRWACSDCLRLLSHKHFDIHSVLGLGYRKPSAAIYGPISAVTTWEPVGQRTRRRPKNPKNNDAIADDGKRKQRYFICVTGGQGTAGRLEEVSDSDRLNKFQSCGMMGFEDMTPDEFSQLTPDEMFQMLDENAVSIERSRCGYKRRLRKCNECRYQRRQLPFQSSPSGEICAMPILPNRQFPYNTALDRWFPGFSDNLESRRPGYNAYIFRMYREEAYDALWTEYMARCPGCARWQELRHFRIVGFYQNWQPRVHPDPARRRDRDPTLTWDGREVTLSLLNSARCNSCFALANGREALGSVLLECLDRLLHFQLISLSSKLKKAWGYWSPLLHGGKMPREYAAEFRWHMEKTPCLQQTKNVTHSDIAMLRLRLTQWKDLWERMKANGDTGWASCDLDDWYEQTVREFDEVEGHWLCTVGCREELAERPEALVEWALGEGRGESV